MLSRAVTPLIGVAAFDRADVSRPPTLHLSDLTGARSIHHHR
jgi:hypothetical protein